MLNGCVWSLSTAHIRENKLIFLKLSLGSVYRGNKQAADTLDILTFKLINITNFYYCEFSCKNRCFTKRQFRRWYSVAEWSIVYHCQDFVAFNADVFGQILDFFIGVIESTPQILVFDKMANTWGCNNVVAWPSGLRCWFQAPVISMAWVRIAPLPRLADVFVPTENDKFLPNVQKHLRVFNLEDRLWKT